MTTRTTTGSRWGLVLLGVVAVTTLFAVGLLDNPWIAWFLPFDNTVLARPKLVLLLVVPVVVFVLLPRILWIRGLLVFTTIFCLTLATLDLAFRLVGLRVQSEIQSVSLPEIPWLLRFAPSSEFQGNSYGDLAGMSRDPEVRQMRFIRFQTDRRGFRNTHPGRDIDVLILGDSFGAGLGTTQDSIFATLLEQRYGAGVYNLSYPSGPQYQFVNLQVEFPELAFRPHAHVVWVLFTGNDLTDAANDYVDLATLPRRTGLKALRIRYQAYRERSPIRQLLLMVLGPLLDDDQSGAVIRRELPNGEPILFKALYRNNVDLSQAQAEGHPNFPRIERAMAGVRQFTLEHDLDLTVVILPAKAEVYRWILEGRARKPTDLEDSGFGRALLDACRRVDIRCLDAKPVLTREAYRIFDASGELVFWRDDTHINDRGHAIITDFIARNVLLRGDSTISDAGIQR